MIRQLRCADLQPGDILLKVSDGSILSKAIQLGQNLAGGTNTSVVHAGVLFDKTFMIEAQAAGIVANDLRVQNRHYGYHVARSTRPNLGAGAGTCAKLMFDIHARGRNLGYSIAGAVGSLLGGRGRPTTRDEMDALFDRIVAGRSQRFFCSQFVVYVYQFAAEQSGIPASSVFPLGDAKVEPSALASAIARNGAFREVGYLLPDER